MAPWPSILPPISFGDRTADHQVINTLHLLLLLPLLPLRHAIIHHQSPAQGNFGGTLFGRQCPWLPLVLWTKAFLYTGQCHSLYAGRNVWAQYADSGSLWVHHFDDGRLGDRGDGRTSGDASGTSSTGADGSTKDHARCAPGWFRRCTGRCIFGLLVGHGQSATC